MLKPKLQRKLTFFSILSALVISHNVHALPIDWHGVFGVDTTLIDSFRRIDKPQESISNTGSQEVPLASGAHANASWQSYIFRLNPDLIVNDAATIKAEITNGYPRGGRLGDASGNGKRAGMGNALYYYNSASTSEDTLVLNKLYMELYSDTATYKIGRHSSHWGLGAIYNGGDQTWDRHLFTRDGVTVDLNLGNFKISPFWSKVAAGNSLTRATYAKEYGISILYDNTERELSFGILFAKKQANKSNVTDTTQIEGTSQSLGETDAQITDLYFKKGFGDFNFSVEVPIMGGEIGTVYSGGGKAKYKAKAIITETSYRLNNRWKLGLNAGMVDGHAGSQSDFGALYLNPNYQIANLLFRYNMRAVSNPSAESVYDSYITNALYAKFFATYETEKWLWDMGLVYAKAREAAKAGGKAFNHESNRLFDATANQSDDLGMEIDLGFNYKWNSEVHLGGSLAYLFTGDYYGYTNTATENATKDSWAASLRAAITF